MNMYLLSDNRDTLVGMRIAGVKGIVVNNGKEAQKELDKLLKDREVGIIIITEKLADMIRGSINTVKQKMDYPLLVEIPDRHGSKKDPDYITGYVRESIGIKI